MIDTKNMILEFGENCLLTNKLHKNLNELQMIEKSKEFHENLINEIDESMLTQNFEQRLRFEPLS